MLAEIDEIGLDPSVLLFAAALSLLAGVVLGLIPALKYGGPRVAGAIRQEVSADPGPGTGSTQSSFSVLLSQYARQALGRS